jgi:DNA-damage-inducible protein J
MSEAQLNAELEKGYASMQAGRTLPAAEVFASIRRGVDE